MPHWLDPILKILDAETTDLRELAKIAGGDPKTFYIGTSIDGANISGQDLRGMIFTKVDFSKIKYDQLTQIDISEVDSDFDDSRKQRSEHDIKFMLGNIKSLLQSHRYEDAIFLCKPAVEKYPDVIDFWTYFIDALIRSRQYDQAEEIIARALSIHPLSEVLFLKRIRIEVKLKNNDKAIEIATEMLRDVPESRSIAAALYDLHLRHGSISNMLSELEHLVNPYGDPQRLVMMLANSYRVAGRLEESEHVYGILTRRFPTDASSWNGLSSIMFDQGKAAESVSIYAGVIYKNEKNTSLWRGYAQALIRTGDFDGAVSVYRRLYTARPWDPQVAKWLGDALFASGNYKDGIAVFESGTKLDRSDINAYKWLTNAYLKINDYKKALAASEAAVERFPDNKIALKWRDRILSFEYLYEDY